ncbi:MAG: hypothetical protein R3C52_10160 [Hyphomonadaceae bacterium]
MIRAVVTLICAALWASASYAQGADAVTLSGKWVVRDHSPRFWRLHHPDLKDTIVIVRPDARANVSMAQAFEEAKARHGEADNCPALITAESEPEYDKFDAAMAAISKVTDPDAGAGQSLSIIGYEAKDNAQRPHCVLIAREYARGAMLYAFITDRGDTLTTKLGSARSAVHEFMDKISDRDKPQPAASRPVQNAQPQNAEACEDVRMYDNWVVSWSPKSAMVYIRRPAFADAAKMTGKKVRLGIMVGGNVDPEKGRQDLHHGIYIAAQDGDREFVPEKRALRVDGVLVQEWSKGGGQWKVLSDPAMQALASGKQGELETGELGRIRFPLAGLDPLLKLADVEEQRAVIKTQLGMCKP